MKKSKTDYVLPEEGVVRLPVVLKAMGICKTTWYNGIKAGIYPKQVKPSRGTVGWRVEELRDLIANLEVKENE